MYGCMVTVAERGISEAQFPAVAGCSESIDHRSVGLGWEEVHMRVSLILWGIDLAPYLVSLDRKIGSKFLEGRSRRNSAIL